MTLLDTGPGCLDILVSLLFFQFLVPGRLNVESENRQNNINLPGTVRRVVSSLSSWILSLYVTCWTPVFSEMGAGETSVRKRFIVNNL